MLRVCGVITATILWSACPAHAQRNLRVPTLAETPLPFLVKVVAPAARHAIVSEQTRTLVVGHRPEIPAQISLFKLDEQGQIVPGDPVKLTLPKPAALGDRPNQVLGFAVHATLPLLYVWQDVPALPEPQVIDPALVAEFDHLLIYSLDETPPKLIYAGCRGEGYQSANNRGGFALDNLTGPPRRLYVPSMRVMNAMKKPVPAIGWLRLAPDGLPLFVDSDVVEIVPESPAPPVPVLDVAAAVASRAARLAAFEAAGAAGKPQILSRYAEAAFYSFSIWPCPDTYAPLNDNSILMASYSGAVSWNLADRLGRYGYSFVLPSVPYRYRLAKHPTLPVAFVSTVTYNGMLVRLEHAEGYFTLTPQSLSLESAVIHSPPVVLPTLGRVIVGAQNRVCSVALTPEGKLTTDAVQMTVDNPTVEALAWSEKFKLLYVPVEK